MVRFFVAFGLALLGHFYLFQYSLDLGSEIPPQLISDSSVSVTLNESLERQENPTPEMEPIPVSTSEAEMPPVLPLPTPEDSARPEVTKEVVQPIEIKQSEKKKKKTVEPPAAEEMCESPPVENDNIVEKVEEQLQQERETSSQKSNPTQDTPKTKNKKSSKSSKKSESQQTTSSVIEARPLYQYNPKPEYPALARQRGWEGIVRLLVEVTASGDVASVRLQESCGYKILDKSAIRAVKGWRFIPGTKDGLQLQSTIMIPVHFKLH